MPLTRRRKAGKRSSILLPEKLRTLLPFAAVALAVVLLVLLLRPSTQLMNMPEISRARRLGVLRVGVRADVPGLSDGTDGLEVQLARALAARIFPDLDPDIALELVPVTAYTALPRLRNGDIDITFSQQRNKRDEQTYTYSEPYYRDTVIILSRPEDVSAPIAGKAIALIKGTTAEAAWTSYVSGEAAKPSAHYYASYPDMITALRLKKEDFVAVPGALVSPYLKEEGVVLHSQNIGSVGYVAVSSAESPAFALLADVVISDLQRDGTLDAWIEKYGLTAFYARGLVS